MKVLIIGAGAIGSVLARILSKRQEFEEVTVADLKIETAQALIKRIENPRKLTAIAMNAGDVDNMKKGMKNVDLVINATLPRFFLKIMQACLETGSNYMDLATDLGVAGKDRAGQRIERVPIDLQLEQDEAWKAADLSAMLCWGADPGAVNVFARYAADKLDRVDQVLVRDGDNSIIEGYDGFASFWSPDTFIEEVGFMQPLIWTSGHFQRITPLSKNEFWDFPAPIGRLRVWAVDHEEPETIGRYIKGCKDCNFMLSLTDETVQILRALIKLGLVDPDPIDVKGVKVVPRDVVTACMPSTLDPRFQGKVKGSTCVGAMVIGQKGEQRVGHYVYNIMSHETANNLYKATATAAQTALPPAVAATLFAQGLIKKKGAYPPETLNPLPLMNAFTEFGFTWHETSTQPTV
jgi:saccharopine dehydrogenase-like NADP-dependent oxidoreductase